MNSHVNNNTKNMSGIYLQGSSVKRKDSILTNNNSNVLTVGNNTDINKMYLRRGKNDNYKTSQTNFDTETSVKDNLDRTPIKRINTTSWKTKTKIEFNIDEDAKNVLEDFQNIMNNGKKTGN